MIPPTRTLGGMNNLRMPSAGGDLREETVVEAASTRMGTRPPPRSRAVAVEPVPSESSSDRVGSDSRAIRALVDRVDSLVASSGTPDGEASSYLFTGSRQA
jgi:hypothetical protein